MPTVYEVAVEHVRRVWAAVLTGLISGEALYGVLGGTSIRNIRDRPGVLNTVVLGNYIPGDRFPIFDERLLSNDPYAPGGSWNWLLTDKGWIWDLNVRRVYA